MPLPLILYYIFAQDVSQKSREVVTTGYYDMKDICKKKTTTVFGRRAELVSKASSCTKFLFVHASKHAAHNYVGGVKRALTADHASLTRPSWDLTLWGVAATP